MSPELFARWLAFEIVEGIGTTPQFRAAGEICSTLVALKATKKGQKLPGWKDFFPEPKLRESAKPQTWQDQLLLVRRWHAALGGKDG